MFFFFYSGYELVNGGSNSTSMAGSGPSVDWFRPVAFFFLFETVKGLGPS